ncbi:Cytochrome c553 [Marinobacter daqiaonensis]|uniref:Cytochrome c553 n=1 Tax=Marinobacter daqiaonensis TaxID=650891 RepID=A0A1I6JQ64_9GAMM|nr:cytochrome c [Marinobacter daqiaonensis]SFR81087.1 Cytochrome c553 [Marinobacter daqiaonensis]
MSFKKLLMAAALTSVAIAPALVSAADVEAGKKKSAVCAACHGQNGIAQIPGYPNLAGQNAAYLVSALTAYKNKQRMGGQAVVMQGQAAGLSDEDMANLAAYYASLPADGGK